MLITRPIGNIASGIFGLEYINAESEDLGVFKIGIREPVDIIYKIDPNIKMTMLPPGGYVIRFLEGSYILLNESPTKFVVGGVKGLTVQWASGTSMGWTEANFGVQDILDVPEFPPSTDVSELSYLEFTKSHRLRLVPPVDVAGAVTVRVVRYVPEHLSDWSSDKILDKVVEK